MLATLDERPIPRAFPLGLDPDLNQQREAESMPRWPWRAGFPSSVNDDAEPSLNLNDHLIRNPDSTFLVRVAGEALAEAGLHDGDLLVMDRATPPLAGSVVLVVVDGASVLTRLGRDAQGRLRVPAAGTDLSRPLDDAITITGVARWVIHRLWPGRLCS
ncbi:MAG TPA: S24 family peptidase [Candidatus Contendobacter sp.]|nr:S24 family peptidase [Candidatus Contendobacter sp.]HRZ52186.1 S24 family peptidase [Candidatus Contendobacter sp.]